jgi:hypothetical protein
MRRLLFWHRHSVNHQPTLLPQRVRPTDRFRKLAFQALEPRNLKAVDTTMLVALPVVTSADPTGAETVQVSSTATSSVIASTADQAAVASSSTAAQSPVEFSAVQTGGGQAPVADGSAVAAPLAANNSMAPANNGDASQTGSPTRLTSQGTDRGSRPIGEDGPGDKTASPVETAPQSTAAASDSSAKTDSNAVTGIQNNGVAVQTNSQSPSTKTPSSNADPSISQGGTSGNSIGRSAVAPTAASSLDGTGGNATGYDGTANGYGGTANDGYGGDTGYGGDPGYGGAPRIDGTTVTDAPTNTIISGTVSGENNLAGSTVVFGGQLNGYTTTVNGNNQFQIEIPSVPPIHGTVTVTVIDSHGTPSNTVIIYLS